jgi:hypothetical protein
VIDSAIVALDRRMGGSLTKDGRHRKEPVRMIEAGTRNGVGPKG